MVKEVRKAMLYVAYKVGIISWHNMLTHSFEPSSPVEEGRKVPLTGPVGIEASRTGDKGKSLAIPFSKKRKATPSGK